MKNVDSHTSPCALVVDDDPLIRMNAAEMLADAGFQTLEASHVEEALNVLHQHHPAIVLLFTDVQMPGALDGFALARHTAAHWPHISIVVASGRAQPGPDDMPEGARFVGKPFSAEVVFHHLKQVVPVEHKPEPLRA
ncbi:response regulator [Methylobacterium sp. 17Sr1-1]|uniref:response regulator n=1 Tax=Methylobacterium sp. 17Sr1-1 TaxID=2202826 RepID=UPI001951A2C7|nr:response regulator [Methylobacterium sp. 17Sr1-1]